MSILNKGSLIKDRLRRRVEGEANSLRCHRGGGGVRGGGGGDERGLQISQRLRKDHLEPLSNNKRKKTNYFLVFSLIKQRSPQGIEW